jgi:hypothetical protein
MYLMQLTFMKNLKFDFFCKKRLFRIKTALTFTYGLEKKRIIYETLSTRNFTSDFNSHRPFAQILLSQNSKKKYESRKILDFVRKIKKMILKEFFNFFICFFYFLVISKFLYYFGIFKIFDFFYFF